MYLFKNGDRCPCCGQVIEGISEEWLLLFSQTVEILGLKPLPKPQKRFMPELDPGDEKLRQAILEALERSWRGPIVSGGDA